MKKTVAGSCREAYDAAYINTIETGSCGECAAAEGKYAASQKAVEIFGDQVGKLFCEPIEMTLSLLSVALMATICESADPVHTVDQLTRFMCVETRRLQRRLGRAQSTKAD